MSSPTIPLATYRLQFNKDFTFKQATRIVPYLAALGISHCYASPYLRARPGSTHGYDIIDHHHLNPEIARLKNTTVLSPLCASTAWGRFSTSFLITWEYWVVTIPG